MQTPKYAVGRLIISEMRRQNVSRVQLAKRIGAANITKALRRLDLLLATGREPFALPRVAVALRLDPIEVERALRETQDEILTQDQEANLHWEAEERARFWPDVLVSCERSALPSEPPRRDHL